MRKKSCLTFDDATRMAAAAREFGARKIRLPTIAIVDAGGHLMYLERPDHQSPNSVEIATMKARTAAFRERPSSALEDRIKERPGWLMFPNSLPIRGGVPIIYEGECVGGIGISGVADDDEAVAQVGADALTQNA